MPFEFSHKPGWKSFWADIHALSYNRTFHYYLTEVIEPAINVLDQKIDDFRHMGGPYEAFAAPDIQSVHRETMVAFCLTVQSMWERQLRAHLFQCASEAEVSDDERSELKTLAQHNRWEQIEKLFLRLRDKQLSEFLAYDELQKLHLVGNVARHGKGKSFDILKKDHSEFWPDEKALPDQPLIHLEQFTVKPHQLRRFVAAICCFWDEIELQRLGCIKCHDSNVTNQINELRERQRVFSETQI